MNAIWMENVETKRGWRASKLVDPWQTYTHTKKHKWRFVCVCEFGQDRGVNQTQLNVYKLNWKWTLAFLVHSFGHSPGWSYIHVSARACVCLPDFPTLFNCIDTITMAHIRMHWFIVSIDHIVRYISSFSDFSDFLVHKIRFLWKNKLFFFPTETKISLNKREIFPPPSNRLFLFLTKHTFFLHSFS